MDVTFITGNQGKADQLAKWLHRDVPHKKLELDEMQSLDLRIVSEYKARQAYEQLKSPVLVEDVALTLTAMGRLPGTFIRWFLEELGNEGICRLADGLPHRGAVASICYALYDGTNLEFFEHHVEGSVASEPRGDGWGWNPLFIPSGTLKTYAQMGDAEIQPYSMRANAIKKLAGYLQAGHSRRAQTYGPA